VFKTLNSLTSLFISCFILLLGNGLINVLLPVRMGLDGSDTEAIGVVLSLYYVGMLLGAIYSKNLIARAGHVRMFAGCVAVAAVSILICSLYSDSLLWGLMRFIIGFCNACAFTAMESWLSGSSTKDTRGKVLAMYNAVVLAGLFGGQFFMNIANPAGTTLFVIAGILICASIVPIVLSKNSGPVIGEVSSMSLLKLYHISPLGVVCCLSSGIIYSALFNLLPVFASHYGIVDFNLSLYVGAAIFGAFILQFPVGYLSDRFDRRSVLLCLLLISALASLLVISLISRGYMFSLFVATATTGGIIACIYPLSIAAAFDRLRQSEMVAAMGSLILAFSLGGIIGPFTVSITMSEFGNDALFYYLAIVQLLLAGFVVLRMSARHALPVEDQENFVMQGAAMSSSIELDPRSEYVEQEKPLSVEAKTAITIAEIDPAAAVSMAQAVALKNPELGVGVAAAVATVENIDVMKLYEVMKQTIPQQIQAVTRAIVTARPELAYDLVSQLAQWQPNQVIEVAAEIGRSFPDLRVDMAKVAVEAAPESATQVAEYYAQVLSEEHEATRPADRREDHSEEDAVNIAAELWQGAEEQGLDVIAAMADGMPKSSVSLAQEYIASHQGDNADDLDAAHIDISASMNVNEQPAETAANELEAEFQNTVDLVARLAEAAPEQALDMAVAVVEALPGSAAEVASQMANSLDTTYVEIDTITANTSAIDGEQLIKYDDAVELVHRIGEVSPDHAMDVAVAVVEALPDSAAEIASEYLEYLSDTEPSDEGNHEEAVELVQRLSEVSPDNTVDVAVAIVEAIPESASDIVDAISEGDNPADEEWMNSIDEKPG
jgi:MFS family permease